MRYVTEFRNIKITIRPTGRETCDIRLKNLLGPEEDVLENVYVEDLIKVRDLLDQYITDETDTHLDFTNE